MLRKLSIFLLLFSILIESSLCKSGNQHLLEAFLRSGNLDQAEKFIKVFPGEGPEFKTLRSVVSYCRSEEGAIQDLKEAWLEVGHSFKKRASEHLINCLSDKEPEMVRLMQLKQIFGDKITSSESFRNFFINSLLFLGEFEEIRKYSGGLDTVSIIEAFVQAHQGEKFRKQLLERLLQVPKQKGAIVQKILQSLIEMGEKDLALQSFEELRSRRQPWVADIYIYLGEELQNHQFVVEGYRRRITLNPLNFESYRGLATHYFGREEMRLGDEVLLKYLRKFPHKYQGAKEIAQVLIDFGRFEELMMFVENMRRQLKDKRAFVDVVLYAYSIRLQTKEFLGEVFRLDPSINTQNWARRIVDSFQIEYLPKVYEEFKSNFSKRSITNLQLILSMVRYSKAEVGSWIDLEFSTFSASDVEAEVKKLLSRSQFEIADRLLRAAKGRSSGLTQAERNLFGQVLYRTGQYSEAYPYLESMTEDYEGSGELYFFLVKVTAGATIWRQFLKRWLGKLKLSNYWKKLSKIDKSFVHYTLLEQQIFEIGNLSSEEKSTFMFNLSGEQKLVLQMIEDLLRSDEISLDGTLKRMKSFLNSELSASKYPMVQYLYLQMIDLKSFHSEDFWRAFLEVMKASLSGGVKTLEDKIKKLEDSIKDHHAEVLFRETLIAYRCFSFHRSMHREREAAVPESRIVHWENAVSKLFEQFPQSLYTPIVMEQLVLYLDTRDLNERRNQWIRRYMLQYSSDLLAQKFRNKLL